MTRSVSGKAVLALVALAASIHCAIAETPAEGAKPFRPAYYACVKASGGVTVALNDCIGNEHAYQDKRLNTAYQSLRKTLPDTQRTSLRDEERSWIATRDKTCAPDQDGGTGAMLDSNQCDLKETALRAAALEARLSR